MPRKDESDPWSPDEQKFADGLLAALPPRMRDCVDPQMLVRFVRGYADEENRAEATLKNLERTITWRIANRIGELALDTTPALLARAARFRELWPSEIYGTGPQGNPILVLRIGRVEPVALAREFPLEDFKNFFARDIEILGAYKDELASRSGRQLYKHLTVVDLAGFGMQVRVSTRWRSCLPSCYNRSMLSHLGKTCSTWARNSVGHCSKCSGCCSSTTQRLPSTPTSCTPRCPSGHSSASPFTSCTRTRKRRHRSTAAGGSRRNRGSTLSSCLPSWAVGGLRAGLASLSKPI